MVLGRYRLQDVQGVNCKLLERLHPQLFQNFLPFRRVDDWGHAETD